MALLAHAAVGGLTYTGLGRLRDRPPICPEYMPGGASMSWSGLTARCSSAPVMRSHELGREVASKDCSSFRPSVSTTTGGVTRRVSDGQGP
eukprot:6733594-Alexandrium_andersonii.AAC.1